MKNVCLVLIRAYQTVLGPFFGGNCRFYPSCSQYAAEAIERHGTRRGSRLALRRLLRCHPFSPGGVDLVPEEIGPGAEPVDGENSTVVKAVPVPARTGGEPQRDSLGEVAS